MTEELVQVTCPMDPAVDERRLAIIESVSRSRDRFSMSKGKRMVKNNRTNDRWRGTDNVEILIRCTLFDERRKGRLELIIFTSYRIYI